MSSKNRRNARKINQLVRMDATRSRMPSVGVFVVFGMCDQAKKYWECCMVPLGNKLTKLGLKDRAMKSLEDARAKRISEGGNP